MRSWRNLKEGDLVRFAAEHGEYETICIVTAVSENRVEARSPEGLVFWIDDDTRHLFKVKGGAV